MLRMHARWMTVLVFVLATVASPASARDEDEGPASAVRIVEPETLNGRPKITDAEVREDLEEVAKNVKEAIPGDETVVVARYGYPQTSEQVQILAVGRATTDRDLELEGMFEPLRERGWTVSALEPVEPGPMGGVAKCADVTTPTGGMSVCAWADAHSVGSVSFYRKKPEEVKTEFVGIRSLIEQER